MEEISRAEFLEIENNIDNWMYDTLDKTIPRYKYIYHCNLAYIDILIGKKIIFSMQEKHFIFSLSYNTHIAYKKLKEEDTFDRRFDENLYKYCYIMLLKGMEYSVICDIFPMVHSEKAKLVIDKLSGKIKVIENYIPRKSHDFINKYSMRKTLSYILQIALGKMNNMLDEDKAMELSKIYSKFWNENLLYEDFQLYSRIDWGGVNFFFTLAAMRRFIKIYEYDFDIKEINLSSLMITCSPNGVNRIAEYIESQDVESLKKILGDFVYKPLGKGLYPKLSIEDAPLIKTKDGYIFTNPLLLLYNNSNETRLLNYLRKFDNARYLKLKDKVKERGIPLIIEMINYKFPDVKVIYNFNVAMPKSKKLKRECDLLLIDKEGYAIYIEVKDFYNPISYCERKNIDLQFNLALDKMPDQINAILQDWDNIKQLYNIQTGINELKSIILSQLYIGYDVRNDKDTLLIDTTTLYECIAKARNLREMYQECKAIDDAYKNVKLITKEFTFKFGKYVLNANLECLNPIFEKEFNDIIRKNIYEQTKIGEDKRFRSLKEVAIEYIKNNQ